MTGKYTPHLLLLYLKKHKKSLILYPAFLLINTAIYYLYRLPLEAVLYAFLLCVLAAGFVTALDFVRYSRRVKRLEESKRHISHTLENLPEPADILEEQYQQLLRLQNRHNNRLVMEAAASRQEMTDYYTMWVHQIKTPIAAISLLLQTDESLSGTELPGELFKIQQYVEMVLQYLRLDSPDSDLVLKTYSLDSIVRDSIRKYARVFIRKGITLQYTALCCQALTDEKWLSFVIEQLLSNALKYTPHGSVSIYMEENSACPTRKILVIEDTGIGISPEDLPRVFEKGYTGVNGRMDKKSTGIGLYLCKRIMTRLSHRISIQSTVGKGTKVLLDLDTLALETE